MTESETTEVDPVKAVYENIVALIAPIPPIAAAVGLITILLALLCWKIFKRKPKVADDSKERIMRRADFEILRKKPEYIAERQKCMILVKEIQEKTKEEKINIVVVGRRGAGKSSLINTIITAFADEVYVEGHAIAAGDKGTGEHVTKIFTEHTVPGTNRNIQLVDTVGVERIGGPEDKRTTYDELWDAVFRGEFNNGMTMEEAELYDEKDSFFDFETTVTPNHAVILVSDGDESFAENGAFLRKILQSRAKMTPPIPMIGVVTKVDHVVKNYKNVSELLLEHQVAGIVDSVRNDVQVECFPVRSYDETMTYQDPWINLAALEAFAKVVHLAVSFKRRKAERPPKNPTSQESGLGGPVPNGFM